jgi:chromosome segregation ATPase
VKELEGQVGSAKSAQAELQAQQLALEEEAGALRASDEAMQARLLKAAEAVHAAQREGGIKVGFYI